MNFQALLKEVAARHKHPLLFATVSGAHLYGFPSPDSDYDLRGVHVLSVPHVVGFDIHDETLEYSGIELGIELDLVTHDVKKFFSLMLKRNGYVLEQLFSPLVVQTSAEHEELKSIASGCITSHHSYHYRGFAETQWKLFSKEERPRVKPLLYVYRVLLTGIHLMRTGIVEANLVRLNEEAKLSHIDDLIAQKIHSREQQTISDVALAFHRSEYVRLVAILEDAARKSDLPERPSSRPALDELLRRVRLKYPS